MRLDIFNQSNDSSSWTGYPATLPASRNSPQSILPWLRGFLVIFVYLVWFSLCLSLFWELRDNGVWILGVMLEFYYEIWPLWPFVFCLSFISKRLNNITTSSTNQSSWPDSERHQYGISVAEFRNVSPGETTLTARSKEKRLYSQGRARGKGKWTMGTKLPN